MVLVLGAAVFSLSYALFSYAKGDMRNMLAGGEMGNHKADDSDRSASQPSSPSEAEKSRRTPDRAPSAKRDQPSSMVLLQTILDSALDPGYRKAAEAGERPLSWWRVVLIAVLVVLLGLGTGMAIRSLRAQEGAAGATRAALLTQVEEKQANAEALRDEVDLMEKDATARAESMSPISQLPGHVHLSSADQPAFGPGIVFELSDGDNSVRDSEVRALTNLLWQSGAEAISINGIRLGPTTTIRTAGAAILVDFRGISSPYVVEAVGDQQAMFNALQQGASGEAVNDLIRSRGLTLTVNRKEQLDLDAATLGRLKHSEAIEYQ